MSEKKRGRPKKQQQTKPLIFERSHGRVERTVSMSPYTAAQLDRYVAWAAAEVGAQEDEAMMLTIDQALTSWFRRDQLFRKCAEDKTETGTCSAPIARPASPPALPKPSLPPPPVPSRPGVPT